MKVELNKVVPEFQPIKLTVVFESQEELKAIRTMSSFNESIPDLVGSYNPEEFDIVKSFLDQLRDGIDTM